MVCCSVFLRRPASTPDKILKSVWRRDNFLLSLILVEVSLLILGLKTKKEFFMDSGSLPEVTISLSTSLRWCPRDSQQDCPKISYPTAQYFTWIYPTYRNVLRLCPMLNPAKFPQNANFVPIFNTVKSVTFWHSAPWNSAKFPQNANLASILHRANCNSFQLCYMLNSAKIPQNANLVPIRNKLFVGTILIKNGTTSMKVGTIAVR